MGVNLFQYKTFQNIANGVLEFWSFGVLERKEVTIFFYISKINLVGV